MQKNLNVSYGNYEVIGINDNRWDTIIKQFKDWEVFYLSCYIKAFHIGEPLLYYFNNGDTKALNVFYKRDISNEKCLSTNLEKNKFFDITSQYGYGGFLIEGDDIEAVNNSFIKYCKEQKYVSEIVRFGLFNSSKNNYYGEISKVKKNVVRKINMKPEIMLKDFEYQVRKNLKRAEQNNLKIMIDEVGNTLDEYLKIYYETMQRNNAKKEYYFSKEFFKDIFKMKENAVIFNVLYENKIISTELIIYNQNNCYSFLGGTLSEYYLVRPNDFLKYEVIKWAYKNKIKNYVLGGGYTNSMDDGILKYKEKFAPNDELIDFYIGKKIFDKTTYNKLLKIKGKNSNFFPGYRE